MRNGKWELRQNALVNWGEKEEKNFVTVCWPYHTHTVLVRETISAYHHHRALWSSSGEENRVQPEGKTKWLQRRGSSGSIYLQWQSEQHPTSSTGILPYRRTTTTTTTTATTTALAVAQLPGHWQTMPLIALWQLHFTTLSVSLCS